MLLCVFFVGGRGELRGGGWRGWVGVFGVLAAIATCNLARERVVSDAAAMLRLLLVSKVVGSICMADLKTGGGVQFAQNWTRRCRSSG